MTRPGVSASETRALAVTTAVLGLVALFTVRAFVAPMLVGAFFAALTAPVAKRLTAGKHRHVAAFLTAALVILLVLPVAILAVPVAGLITEALDAVTHGQPGELFRALTRGAGDHSLVGSPRPTLERVGMLLQQFGPGAAGLATRLLGSLSSAVVQIFVLIASAYVCTAQGHKMMDIARRGSPLNPAHFDRLGRGALDVARAMLVGGLLTALAQALVALVIYVVVAVPNAVVFAALTGLASMIPAVGTALVWVPLCGVLYGAGHGHSAVILAVCGVVVISTVDNLLRPFLARAGADDVHPMVLFVGVMGGLVAFGPWGLVLGPLTLALFVSAYRLRAGEPEHVTPGPDAET